MNSSTEALKAARQAAAARRRVVSASAIEAVYRSQAARFRGLAAAVAGADAASDVVQDAFALALRRRATWRGDGPLEAWLWRLVLNAAWLVTLPLVVAADRWPDPFLLAFFLVLQALRVWVLLTLGERWTTRIITLEGTPPVCHGPYRFVRHPNYLIVASEILVLPLAFGLPLFAVLFSGLNALVLWVRIRAEDAALHGERRHGVASQ